MTQQQINFKIDLSAVIEAFNIGIKKIQKDFEDVNDKLKVMEQRQANVERSMKDLTFQLHSLSGKILDNSKDRFFNPDSENFMSSDYLKNLNKKRKVDDIIQQENDDDEYEFVEQLDDDEDEDEDDEDKEVENLTNEEKISKFIAEHIKPVVLNETPAVTTFKTTCIKSKAFKKLVSEVDSNAKPSYSGFFEKKICPLLEDFGIVTQSKTNGGKAKIYVVVNKKQKSQLFEEQILD